MLSVQKITPFLWFDDQAEEAVEFYTSIFPQSKILTISRYGEAGQEVHRRVPGSVMVVSFELTGQRFNALNGGPQFTFNEAVSFQIDCDTQEELDDFWNKLSEGGDPAAQQCGWLKDKYGLSWQVVPSIMADMITGADVEKGQRVMQAMMSMKKIDIEKLQEAYAG
ncbi:VOC family protein [Oxalobacteraceae bacterium]|nr:VOC family protein [Oxalobacteraceae bacterium]